MNANHLWSMQQMAEERVRLRRQESERVHRQESPPVAAKPSSFPPLWESDVAQTEEKHQSEPMPVRVVSRAPEEDYRAIHRCAPAKKPDGLSGLLAHLGEDSEQTFLLGLIVLLVLNQAPFELIAALVYLAL